MNDVIISSFSNYNCTLNGDISSFGPYLMQSVNNARKRMPEELLYVEDSKAFVFFTCIQLLDNIK